MLPEKFALIGVARSVGTVAYHGGICANGKPQQWELSDVINTSIYGALIVSLRSDLQRLAGKRS